jgi:DNA-directed RNA polymerase subunit RPC12/RpoP
MQSKVTRWFTDLAGALLLAASTAMFISNGASAGFVQPRDPLFGISMPMVFWLVGAAGCGVGLVCLFGKQAWLKLNLVLWFALNFWAYQLGLFWTAGPRGFNGYWGNLADAFGISSIAAGLILKMFFLYLLIGGFISLFLPSLGKTPGHADDYMKISCPSCGGHVKFAAQNIGQQIACPHCQSAVTLRKPDENLKMTCVLCGGNIEFPAHALGQKIPCPHCAKTITLLNPT